MKLIALDLDGTTLEKLGQKVFENPDEILNEKEIMI